MKLTHLPLFVFILASCTTDRKEDACFENDKEEKTAYQEFRIDTLQEILRANPSHVKFTVDKNLTSYNKKHKKTGNLIRKQKIRNALKHMTIRLRNLSKISVTSFIISIPRRWMALYMALARICSATGCLK
ncbi:hypothetical protein [uncultured Chryseobacterium sp.]|uniref:hypothetical protein n=1 Tax=uncultured Chryseobacterium sp. TaxID=259322 RepID=UPI0026007FFF|nr:hypothetical protein [uncultured Chryseobacterium sp.]